MARKAAAARGLATVRVGRPGSMVAMARKWRAPCLPIPPDLTPGRPTAILCVMNYRTLVFAKSRRKHVVPRDCRV